MGADVLVDIYDINDRVKALNEETDKEKLAEESAPLTRRELKIKRNEVEHNLDHAVKFSAEKERYMCFVAYMRKKLCKNFLSKTMIKDD